MTTRHLSRRARKHFLSSAAMAVAIAVAGLPPTASAQESVRVDIEAQPLSEALGDIGNSFGVTVIAPDTLVRGKSAPPISGSLTAAQAIARVLSGSGLTYRQTRNGGFVVQQQTAQLEPVQPTRSAQVEEPVKPEEPVEMEMIIVRGTRSNRTEFETPTSVAVFTEEDLDKYPFANDTEALLDRLPNVTVTDGNGETVRGVPTIGALGSGAFSFSAGARPRLVSAVDGYAQSFNEYVEGVTGVYDVSQIEVFRGPQTTSQGANAIAGAIYVFTNDPTFDYEAGTLIEVGNLNSLQTAGYISGPIIEGELATRITVDYRQTDSPNDFSAILPADFILGETKSLVTRAKLLWTPSHLPGFEAKLTFNYADVARPNFDSVLEPFEDRISSLDQSFSEQQNYTGILDLSYEIDDRFTLTNQLAITDFNTDVLVSPVIFGTDGLGRTDGTRITNETILRYSETGFVTNALAGVYFIHQDQTQSFLLVPDPQITEDEQDSLGLFTEVTFALTGQLELTTGLRYQRDTQDREGFFFAPIDFDVTFDAFLPKVALAYDVSDDIRIGVSASRGFNPGGEGVDFITGATFTFDEETVWTYDAYIRSELLNGRLSLQGNVFFSDYDGFQNTSIVGFDPITGNAIIDINNAPDAETYGFEGSFNFEATDYLTIFGSLGLLDTEFLELTPPAPGTLQGFEFAAAPNVTAFFGVDVRPIKNLTVSGQVRFVDSYFSEDDNIPENFIDSYVTADLSARYVWRNFEFYGYVENLTDNFFPTLLIPEATGQEAILGRPITYGGGVKVSF